MASRTHLLVVGFSLLAAFGCDKSEPSKGSERAAGGEPAPETGSSQSGPTIVHPDGPEPDPETVVARSGGIEVTFRDYELFLRRSRLFAPSRGEGVAELPAERKANPRLQSQSTRSLLEYAVLRRAAEEHGVSIDSKAIETFVREHEKLGRWASVLESDAGGASGLPKGMGAEDLRAVARRRLLRRKLRKHLVEVPEGEKLWELYRRRNTTVRVGYVAIDNTPVSDAIDAFVERHGGDRSSRLRTHFEEHIDRYRMPKLVRLSVVRPPPGKEVETKRLRRAARRLDEGASPQEVADELGLEYESKALLRRAENQEAFESETGSTGYQTDGPRGAYAWRVEGWREGRTPDLDRAIKREVAADILRESVVASARRTLKPVLAAMRRAARKAAWPIESSDLEPVRDALPEGEGRLETTEPFRRNDQGRVPGLGIAEPVMEKAFELTRKQPVADEALLTRGRAVALMLLDRDAASREQFEKQREAFRRRLEKQRRKRAVQTYLEEWFSEHRPEVDLQPVQVKYGRLEK